jgi:hypothetical protein
VATGEGEGFGRYGTAVNRVGGAGKESEDQDEVFVNDHMIGSWPECDVALASSASSEKLDSTVCLHKSVFNVVPR